MDPGGGLESVADLLRKLMMFIAAPFTTRYSKAKCSNDGNSLNNVRLCADLGHLRAMSGRLNVLVGEWRL
jgi:hypothetical protein